ncbi:MAG: D-tyrosyl-tRNA(Tyr) deacylase [Rhodospirillaceae bacterium]|nr:D-tyrosyl-tRNA(Tyr) deacylase [Rhodospirillaceae bacterium]
MRVVVQRVAEASVRVDGVIVGEVGQGFLILFCAEAGDADADAAFLARKIAALRIFTDDAGKMNLSLKDVGGGALVVSQFTLAAQWRNGNRPGFSLAAPPDEGDRLYRLFCDLLFAEGVSVATGVFGASMAVSLVNQGPVTILMDTRDPR